MILQLQTRNSASFERSDLTARTLTLRESSINEEERSFEAVCATEQMTVVRDFQSFRQIDEVLVATGGEFPEQIPLLDNHFRFQTIDQIGAARNFRRSGSEWMTRGFFAEDSGNPRDMAGAIWTRVRDRFVKDVSIGYLPLEWVDIPAGQSEVVQGKRYKAGRRTLRITTRWRAIELSITPIGADDRAKIRTQPGQEPQNTWRVNPMNERLRNYLYSLGMARTATDEQAREFLANLRGANRSIANLLDYEENDQQGRTTCDLGIRALGFNPENPSEMLAPTERSEGNSGSPSGTPASPASNENGTPAATATGRQDTTPTNGQPANGDGQGAMLREAEERGRQQERLRVQQINELGELSGCSQEFIRTLAADSTLTVETARQRILEDHRQRRSSQVTPDMPSAGPAIHSRNTQTGITRDALSAALMMRQGVDDPTRSWTNYNPMTGTFRHRDVQSDETILRAVDQAEQMRELALRDIVVRGLALDNIRCEPTPSAIRHACQQNRSLISTGGFLGIFTQTFGALLLRGHDETEDTTQGWTVERENPNFLQNERHTMNKMGGLTKHARGKTADHMDNDDDTQYTKVNRYTGKFTIDEIDLINDTFGALNSETPGAMGAAARRLRPDLVYYILLANPNLADGSALFIAGNLHTGQALGKSTLEHVRAQMMLQVARPGVPIDAMPRFIGVPPSLEATLDDLVESLSIVLAGVTGSNTILPSGNNIAKKGYVPVVERRLELGVTDPDTGATAAGSATDWFVMSDQGPRSVEVTYRAGGPRSPQIRSKMLDDGQWGIGFDVLQDIGAKALNRAGVHKAEA